MKICYVANSASSHTAKWVNYFLSIGHEVHVISHSDVKIEGAKNHYIDYSLKNFLFKSREVHKLIEKINPDVLHAHQANTCGFYAATMKKYPLVVSAWGSDILVTPNQSIILKKIIQYVIKKAKIITSDSFYMSKKIVELGGTEETIYTFPMGVEEELLNYKHQYNLKEKNLNILSTRRLEKMYNVDVIIKGFYEALKENPNMLLTVAADGSEMSNLKKLANDLGISNNVVFKGAYKLNQLTSMLQESDVFVSIPDSDATSVSLLESMCCGLFPIVSDLPANREWINDGENGLIVKNIDKECVRDSISWCVKNKKHLSDVSKKNMKMIEDKALWKNNAKIVEGIYEKIKK